MRIISGQQKGHRISSGKNAGIRPTSDRVRESIFNVLREEVAGKRILDLFAGAGGLGLEALSRGATSVTFVDASSQSTNVLRKNLEKLKVKDRSSVIRQDGLKALHKLRESFDIVFADPPYGKGFAQRIVESIAQSGVLKHGGILVLEHHKKETFSCPENQLSLVKQKRFGDTMISFFLNRDPKNHTRHPMPTSDQKEIL
jgi:16S rRNA (guanine966-N2)-methyltransferase